MRSLAYRWTEGNTDTKLGIGGTRRDFPACVSSVLDVQLEVGLKAGCIVHMPNGAHFEPVGKKDGSININLLVHCSLEKKVNGGFR